GLGVRPDEERVFVLADGRAVRYPIAWVRVRLDERTQPTLVVCGDSGTEPLLGALTHEGFGLGVDPVNRRLIPVPGLLKPVACGSLVSQFHFTFLLSSKYTIPPLRTPTTFDSTAASLNPCTNAATS